MRVANNKHSGDDCGGTDRRIGVKYWILCEDSLLHVSQRQLIS